MNYASGRRYELLYNSTLLLLINCDHTKQEELLDDIEFFGVIDEISLAASSSSYGRIDCFEVRLCRFRGLSTLVV
jgi:hypothetical protein